MRIKSAPRRLVRASAVVALRHGDLQQRGLTTMRVKRPLNASNQQLGLSTEATSACWLMLEKLCSNSTVAPVAYPDKAQIRCPRTPSDHQLHHSHQQHHQQERQQQLRQPRPRQSRQRGNGKPKSLVPDDNDCEVEVIEELIAPQDLRVNRVGGAGGAGVPRGDAVAINVQPSAFGGALDLTSKKSPAAVYDNNNNINNNNEPVNPAVPESPKNSENDKSAPSDDYKNTYLYRLITDPEFTKNVYLNKNHRSRHYEQPKQQPEPDQAPNPVIGSNNTSPSSSNSTITRTACVYCKREFPDERALLEHTSNPDIAPEGNNNKNKAPNTSSIRCCACGKSFAQKRYLRYHQRCHSDRTKFECGLCTRKYSRLDNLTRHNTFHTNPNKFACTSCDRTFARKDLLNKHVRCHENKFKFYCCVCNKFFKGPVSLKNHNALFHPQQCQIQFHQQQQQHQQ